MAALLAVFRPHTDESTRQDEALAAWTELAETVPSARLYNVHALVAALAQFAPSMHSLKRFQEVVHKLGAVVAERVGDRVAAELAKDRATQLVEAGHVVAALREMHAAKVYWFSRESLAECVRAMEMIADLYEQLGLHMAALYYAQAAVTLLFETGDPTMVSLAPPLLHQIADSKYALGDSYEFIQRAQVALSVDASLVAQDHLEGTLVRYLTTVGFISRFEPRIERAVMAGWVGQPMASSFEANLPAAEALVAELCSEGSEDELPPLFVDCGRVRVHTWRAFGMNWQVACDNRSDDVDAAEMIGAALQIILADVAGTEQVFLWDTAEIFVVVEGQGDGFATERNGHVLHVAVGSEWCFAESAVLAAGLVAVFALLGARRDAIEAVKASLEGGLHSKLIVGGPYPVLRRSSLLGQRVRRLRSRRLSVEEARPEPSTHPELELTTLRLEGYSGAAWDRAIAVRYAKWTKMLGPALLRLGREPSVVEAVREWRAQGVPEWNIIGAVGSFAFSVYCASRYGEDALLKPGTATRAFSELPEAADIDLAGATVDRLQLDRCLEAYLCSFLVSEGILVDEERWEQDAEKYERLAVDRYGFHEPGPTPPDWLGDQK